MEITPEQKTKITPRETEVIIKIIFVGGVWIKGLFQNFTSDN